VARRGKTRRGKARAQSRHTTHIPGLHRQLPLPLPPARLIEFAPQITQELSAEAPNVVENFPAPQSVHRALPVAVLYFPAEHTVHVPPVGPVYPILQRQSLIDFCLVRGPEFDGQALGGASPPVQ
jgi:hypothetical protein